MQILKKKKKKRCERSQGDRRKLKSDLITWLHVKKQNKSQKGQSKKKQKITFFFSQKYLIPLKCWNVTFSVWFFFCVYLNKNIFTIYPITSCRKMFINKTQKIMICFFLNWYHGRRKKKSLTDLINNYNVIKLPF